MMRHSLRILHVLSAVFTVYNYLGLTNGQTIDEMIASSSTAVSDFDFMADITGNVIRVELDMMLTLEQYSVLYNKQNALNSTNLKQHPREKRKAAKSLASRWTNKIIPYNYQKSTFSSRDMSEILKAIEEWEQYTCISFRRATSVDAAFINFEDGSGCSSYIGMGRQKQPISLATGCRYKGVIVHEIGHAVGFFHEQNRPDRDDYVTIKKENIVHPDLYSNFDKYPVAAVSTYDVPYDYKSIMHYGGLAFSGNGQYTIVTKDPAFQQVIGNRKGLSFNDIKLANLMYSCNDGCKTPIKCPAGGFVGKDCQCWCPGDPVKKCEDSNVITQRPVVRSTIRPTLRTTIRPILRTTVRPTQRPTTGLSCKDINANCKVWAKSGYCQSSDYVKTYCKVSCSMCERPAKPTTTTTTCKDFRGYCQDWGKRGYCSGLYANFMSKKCPMTCGLCKKNTVNNNEYLGSHNGRMADNGVDTMSSSQLAFSFGVLIIFLRML